ncbi:hypothetical protein [Marinibacterium profundimaris]|uniref:Lipoprotein n=1 Tax=Marinibacterium profundimaris TaxID=1679460 RepID=A0A225NIR0_9RHOB|nr:hypothetical protein [Marinibacterium profundimaris]OWU73490.1 hypothetical protein ATO3_12565 [Marinibacterium profundimaris]
MIRLALAMSLLTLPILARAQCAELVPLDRDEARQMMSVMMAPEADPLEQLFAFEDLMCADEPVLRNMALRTGASSPSADVRGQILMRSLFEKVVLQIELGEGEPVDPKYRRNLREPGVMTLDVVYRDPARGCMSFDAGAGGACSASSIAEFSGTTMTMKVDRSPRKFLLTGRFDYDHGDTVEGKVVFNDVRYPATIRLF